MRCRWCDWPPKYSYWLLRWDYIWEDPQSIGREDRWTMIRAGQQEFLNDRHYFEVVVRR